MNIVIMGVQGSGKGTQSKKLSRELNTPHISVGDLFRANVNEGSELGSKAKQYMDKGELVPDDIVIDMVKDRLDEDDAAEGFLLDGFPRNGVQMAALEYLRPVDHVIFLELDDDTAVKRLASRLECTNCNIIYGANKPPKNDEVCDKCGQPLKKRSDDQKVEAVRKRLALYHQETKNLVKYYKWKKVLIPVDASKSVDVVFEEIIRKLKNA